MIQKSLKRLKAFILNNQDSLRRQGSVQETWRDYKGQRRGPYYRVICRTNKGGQITHYLGKDCDLVNYARELLKEIQGPHKSDLAAERVRKNIATWVRQSKRNLENELRKFGLQMKGWEIRRGLPS